MTPTPQNLGSLINDGNSCDDIIPQQLSGDQNAQKSIIASEVGGNKANLLLTVTIIMKCVIGAGILSLPLTVSSLGYAISIVAFAFVILLVQFTSVLLLKAKNLSKHSNYTSIAYHIFRTKFSNAICSALILLSNVGTCIAQLLLIQGAIGKILDGFVQDPEIRSKFYCSPLFILLISTVLQLPLTFVKKIQRLRFFAFTGVTGITIYVIVLGITFFIMLSDQKRNWTCHKDMVPVGKDFFKIVIVIPNMILALSYSNNFFPIYKGLKDANDERMTRASLAGVCACSFCYILVGNMGYCLFGNNISGNFLVAFSRGDINQTLYIILNISFLISLTLSFPIQFFVARNNFIALINNLRTTWKNIIKKYQDQDQINQQISSHIQDKQLAKRKKQTNLLFYIYTIILFTFIVVMAATVQNIEDVFNVTGAIAANATTFILPSMFYVYLIRKKNKPRKIQYYLSVVTFVFFIPFGIFSVITNFLKRE